MKRNEQISYNLILLAILAIPFYFLRFNIGPVPTTILEILIYIAFIFSFFSGQLKGVFKNKLVWIALAFVMATLISGIIDPSLMRGLGLWKAYFFDGFLLFILLLSIKDREQIAKIIIYEGLFVSLITLVRFFIGDKTADNRLYDLEGSSPNYIAMYFSTVSAMAIYKIIVEKKYHFISALIVILLATYLTASRGAAIAICGALLAIGTIIIAKNQPKKARIFAVVVGITFIFATAFFFRPRWSDMGRTGSSSNIRYYIWMTSFEMIKEKPIWGVGLGNYQDYFKNLTNGRVNYNEYIAPEALTAHNLYLHLYVTSGILGIGTFVFLLYFAIRRNKSKLFLVALVAILFYGLVDTPVFRNDLAAIFWLILALL